MDLVVSLILLFSVLLVTCQSLILMRVVKRLLSLGDALITNLNDNETVDGQSYRKSNVPD